MAYVLVAVGALMAAAGLYVIGYSALNTRFEEFWASMTTGTTLVAGGIVTVAIGFATRALRDLKAVLSTRALAVSPAADDPPAPLPSIEPNLPLELRTAATPPMSPLELPAQSETAVHPVEAPAPTVEAQDVGTPTSVAAAYAPPIVPPETLPRDGVTQTEPQHPEPAHIGSNEIAEPAARDVEPEPSKSGAPTPPAVSPQTSQPHQMPDDWLDRAFADLDQELPIGSVPRSLPPTPDRPDEPAGTRPHPLRPAAYLDPPQTAASNGPAAPSLAAATGKNAASAPQNPAPIPSPAPDPPTSAVIGRYEAEGTSYVMYADGSIEAQSSAGVYRFNSMAELKSFIES